jgi:hypothetical protein
VKTLAILWESLLDLRHRRWHGVFWKENTHTQKLMTGKNVRGKTKIEKVSNRIPPIANLIGKALAKGSKQGASGV